MTPEQQALLHKAHESLRAAQLLAEHDLFGFALSRAYFAMFYAAEAMLLDRSLSFSKHSGVIAAFGREFVKTGQVPAVFHRHLIDAHQERTIGDYDTLATVTSEQARHQIACAESSWQRQGSGLRDMPRSPLLRGGTS